MDFKAHIEAAQKEQKRLVSLADKADDANWVIITVAHDAIDEALLRLADRRHCHVEPFWIEEALKDLDYQVENARKIHRTRG